MLFEIVKNQKSFVQKPKATQSLELAEMQDSDWAVCKIYSELTFELTIVGLFIFYLLSFVRILSEQSKAVLY